METDKVFSTKSDLVFEGTTEETVNWLARNVTDGCYIRSGQNGELLSVAEFTSLYI